MSLSNNSDIAEKLAIEVSLNNLTNFISYTKNVENAWLWDYSKDVLVVIEAIKLITKWLVYAFRVEDGYSERIWWNSDWVYLFRRIWEKSSINIFSWEHISLWNTSIPDDEDAISFLVENNINRVVTWPIISEFMWIERNHTDDDWDSIKVWILLKSSIEQMRKNWIEVTVLDRLV